MMSGRDTLAAPKFASYQPKLSPSSLPSDQSKPKSGPKQARNGRSETANSFTSGQRKHKFPSVEPCSSSKETSQDDVAKRKPCNQSSVAFKTKTKRDNDQFTRTFLIDEVGDPKNLVYRGLYPPSISDYSRSGNGKIVGLPAHFQVDRSARDEKAVAILSLQPGQRAKSLGISSLTQTWEDLEIIRSKPGDENSYILDITADFVPLWASGRKRAHGHYNARQSLGFSDPTDTQYFSLHEAHSSSEEGNTQSKSVSASILEKRAKLSQKTEVDPSNYVAWIELINFQDTILQYNHKSLKSKATAAEKHSTAELKLNIYEKAIDGVKDVEDRENLILGMMKEASRIWKPTRLFSEWRNIIASNPRSMTLWINFLEFRQSNAAFFQFEEVRTTFLDGLDNLRSYQRMPNLNATERLGLFEIQIYVTLRMTLFMREAGYSEYALASWQAIIEYVFFKPVQFQDQEYFCGGPLESKSKSSFEDFWESESPRIGEEGANGWAEWFSNKGKLAEARKEEVFSRKNAKSLIESWIKAERYGSSQTMNVARTFDELAGNDPYRIIFYSDIQHILFDPPDASSKEMVIEAFLVFGLFPPCSGELTGEKVKVWFQDPYLRNENLYLLRSFKAENIENLDLPSIQRWRNADIFTHPMSNYQISCASLFAATGKWFSPFPFLLDECIDKKVPVNMGLIRRTIRSLVHVQAGGDALAEYFLAVELKFDPAGVRKTAKQLLRERPSSVRLYNAYALTEYRVGNYQNANNVIIKTITLSKTLNEQAQKDSIILWSTWIWELLSSNRPLLALERLSRFPNQSLDLLVQDEDTDSSPLEPTRLLQAQKALEMARDRFLSLSLPHHGAVAVECIILFTYLANKSSLSLAHSALSQNSSLFASHSSSPSIHQEYIYQSFARLLNHHVTTIPLFTPALVRSYLAESINLFPNNTIFLSLYARIESRFRIDDRVRAIVDHVINFTPARNTTRQIEVESVILHFFAISSELRRNVSSGSNVNAIRSTFERAVSSDNGMHCAGLWRLYFAFESEMNEKEKAKHVFWRAVNACPWAKELVLAGMEDLWANGAMEEGEFHGAVDLIAERGLRIHVAVGDVGKMETDSKSAEF